jgi:hypothetical protein
VGIVSVENGGRANGEYVSEESDDQVMVTLELAVGDAGACKFETAVTVAVNARAATLESTLVDARRECFETH